jgi:hypothetical protein
MLFLTIAALHAGAAKLASGIVATAIHGEITVERLRQTP